MKVRYTDTALAEINDILSYIAKDNPRPRMAFETDVPDVSVAPVLPYRYLIFYSVYDHSLVIRNVRHTARKWPPLGRAA
jgi:plasmid stabilization system protein ParE